MVLGTFAAHLVAIQGAQQIPDLEADGAKPTFAQAYGALALCTARVSLCIIFLVHYIVSIRFSMLSCSTGVRQSLSK